MKKIAAVLSTLMLAVVMAGCAKQISGTPNEVVKECQSLQTNEDATATVTGYMTSLTGKDSGLLMLKDQAATGNGGSTVFVYLKDKSQGDKISYGDRVTASGKVSSIRSDAVSLMDATLSS